MRTHDRFAVQTRSLRCSSDSLSHMPDRYHWDQKKRCLLITLRSVACRAHPCAVQLAAAAFALVNERSAGGAAASFCPPGGSYKRGARALTESIASWRPDVINELGPHLLQEILGKLDTFERVRPPPLGTCVAQTRSILHPSASTLSTIATQVPGGFRSGLAHLCWLTH